MTQFDAAKVQRIRETLGHPVVDADGHMVEFLPAVREHLVTLAGEELASGMDQMFDVSRAVKDLDTDTRRAMGLFKMSWWAFPTTGTLDRAAGFLPGFLAEKLPEIGIDFAVLYPTLGLTVQHVDDADFRSALGRAFNAYYAEVCAADRDRIVPVAVIPMHTPEQAIAELDYAVQVQGHRAVVLAGLVARPLPGAGDLRAARWIDSFGPDDPHAYDAVWQHCVELGVSPTFHSSAMGWGTRNSLTNYMYNHIGNFAAAGEASCRSLLLAGVPQRFPELPFAFLEGGVAWGANLQADLIGHFEKRGGPSIDQFSPEHLDRGLLEELLTRYGSESIARNRHRLDEALGVLSDPGEDPETLDEFRHTGVKNVEEIRQIFNDRFFFGCEADDPMTAVAFDPRLNSHGKRLRALLGSDIGHWDVPDMRCVLLEAWELVESGCLDEGHFREFSFENAIDLYTKTNPAFFEGTAVASQVAEVNA
ncbi:MAG: amidohydrolase family protein [Myxococcota bacterium]